MNYSFIIFLFMVLLILKVYGYNIPLWLLLFPVTFPIIILGGVLAFILSICLIAGIIILVSIIIDLFR